MQKREKPMAPQRSHNDRSERKVNSVRPFSSITSHIDPMVLYTFLALLTISVVMLAFKAGNRQDCSMVSMAFSSRQHGVNTSFTVGEVITFKANNTGSAPAGGYTWNFSDSSVQQQGQQVYHAFNKAGSFVVTLQAGKCSWNQEVQVINPIPLTTSTPAADVFPVIDGPTEAFVGRPVTFSNSTPGAKSWEWRLQQPNAETHSERSHTYVFSSPGDRIVTLVVNGDASRMVKKRVNVFPAPQEHRNTDPFVPPPFPVPETKPEVAPPAPEKPKAPAISDEEFRGMLTQLSNKQKGIQDFAPYLCNNLNARVLLNDKDVKTFSQFCEAIRGKKRIKIEMVNLIKDPDGCVKEIRVRYDKKGFLGIF
ncbi:MAG TPA: PKD domain-containing protein [Chitinophaga sp.]|uniref:PKD domain-containing protein n=1 Tax=Chitinophaga sp. TaxID=1869181 RepID=UPI002F947445